MTLTEIQNCAKEFSDSRKILRERVDHIEEEIQTLRKRLFPGIRGAVNQAKEKESLLAAAIKEGKDLFVKPRTMIMFGIKFGIQKQKGKISWADKSTLLKLIKKHFPDSWEIYVKVMEKPMKKTLATLPTADLKKLGIEVSETGDAIFIEPADSEIDKLVDALLNEKREEIEEEEAA